MSAAAKRYALGLALALSAWPALAWGASSSISAQVCPQTFATTTLATTEPTPTINTSAAMTGTAEPGATVRITVNSVLRATLGADSSGNFGATVPLVIGDNTIVAVADDGAFCGDTSTSPPVLIHRNQVPPAAPAITSPMSGTVTAVTSVLVQGSAEANSTLNVLVNGNTVATLTLGAGCLFAVSVPLALGANAIQATATNPAGTGPLSAPINVTRQPPSVLQPPPPAPQPAPAPAPTPAGPKITSPTSGTTTTAASVTVQIQGQPGSTASVSVSGSIVGTLQLASDGTGELSVPLAVGENDITVSIGGTVSPAVTITREQAQGLAPEISSPPDGTITQDASIVVAGRATPRSTVTIVVGNAPAATVVADETGRFEARVSLRAGLNLIYAEVAATDGTTVRSQSVQVTRRAAGLGGKAAAGAKSGLAAVLAIPAAAIILTAQGIAAAVRSVAASPAGSTLVLAFAVIFSTASRGLVGLELILTVPGLLRLLIPRAPSAFRGRVIDSVTGRPLALVKITAGTSNPVHTISGPDGTFVLPASSDKQHIRASRPGFQGWNTASPASSAQDLTITLEPARKSFSPVSSMVDFITGGVAWLTMLFAGLLGAYLIVHSFTPATLVAGIISVGNVLVNVALLATRPRYHWGRLVDSFGAPIPGADVNLLDSSGKPVSAYRTDDDGRYTLYGLPGEYKLSINHGALAVHEEPVNIRRHHTYLGFRMTLPAP